MYEVQEDNDTLILNIPDMDRIKNEDINKIAKPSLKLGGNSFIPVTWKFNQISGDTKVVEIEKRLKNAQGGGDIFYVGDKPDSPTECCDYTQALKSNVLAIIFISILIVVFLILFFYAIYSVGRRTQNVQSYVKLDSRDILGDPSDKNSSSNSSSGTPTFERLELFVSASADARGKTQPDVSKYQYTRNVRRESSNHKNNAHSTEKKHVLKEEEDKGRKPSVRDISKKHSKKVSKRESSSRHNTENHQNTNIDPKYQSSKHQNTNKEANKSKSLENDEFSNPNQQTKSKFNILNWMWHKKPDATHNEENDKEFTKSDGKEGKKSKLHHENLHEESSGESVLSVIGEKIKQAFHCPVKFKRWTEEESDSGGESASRWKRPRKWGRKLKKQKTEERTKDLNGELESIISYEADMSADEGSLKPAPDKLKTIVATGEVKQIDEMLLGQEWGRVYSLYPPKLADDREVSFTEMGDNMNGESCVDVGKSSSMRSLEREIGKSINKAEHVIRKGKPLSGDPLRMKKNF
ncbi:hypothetical protein CDAR_451011 [Caerostris darwini]|uniref:Uncharacterized protein n=1 Tax=Caerostris darwini TaxID=1538125 RepID=A0AAV4PMX3_9ARAC|nr:hypothetical protein CDAR_451011 [Caerostris darwini]